MTQINSNLAFKSNFQLFEQSRETNKVVEKAKELPDRFIMRQDNPLNRMGIETAVGGGLGLLLSGGKKGWNKVPKMAEWALITIGATEFGRAALKGISNLKNKEEAPLP